MDYVVLDVMNLLFRHFYGAKGVSWGDRPKAALHGVLRDLPKLRDRFRSDQWAWCFDAPPYLRREVYPDYKSGRKSGAVGEEAAALDELHALARNLGPDLIEAGYTNVYSRRGYEADDLMAAVRLGLRPADRCVLVTGDSDVWQLLDRRCAVYIPRTGELVTAILFRRTHGIDPARWADVKALAGCDSDAVGGCPGVAEKTAVAYHRSGLPAHHKVAAAIAEFVACGGVDRNLPLVTLPFAGLPPITPAPQRNLPDIDWRPVCRRIGLPPEEVFPELGRKLSRG